MTVHPTRLTTTAVRTAVDAIEGAGNRAMARRELDDLLERIADLKSERDLYRQVIRAALDTMNATDDELGRGGVARRAYADLWHAYHAIPAGIPTPYRPQEA